MITHAIILTCVVAFHQALHVPPKQTHFELDVLDGDVFNWAVAVGQLGIKLDPVDYNIIYKNNFRPAYHEAAYNPDCLRVTSKFIGLGDACSLPRHCPNATVKTIESSWFGLVTTEACYYQQQPTCEYDYCPLTVMKAKIRDPDHLYYDRRFKNSDGGWINVTFVINLMQYVVDDSGYWHDRRIFSYASIDDFELTVKGNDICVTHHPVAQYLTLNDILYKRPVIATITIRTDKGPDGFPEYCPDYQHVPTPSDRDVEDCPLFRNIAHLYDPYLLAQYTKRVKAIANVPVFDGYSWYTIDPRKINGYQIPAIDREPDPPLINSVCIHLSAAARNPLVVIAAATASETWNFLVTSASHLWNYIKTLLEHLMIADLEVAEWLYDRIALFLIAVDKKVALIPGVIVVLYMIVVRRIHWIGAIVSGVVTTLIATKLRA